MFDPNKQHLVPSGILWATYIPNRAPQFKTYAHLRRALAALKFRGEFMYDGEQQWREIPEECKLYKFVDGLWVEVKYNKVFTSGGPEIV